MSYNFTELSQKLTKQLSKEEKKEYGIFLTPLTTIQKNIEFLSPYIKNGMSVLEPSCGSCHFIFSLLEKYDLNITGVEFNKKIFDSIAKYETDKVRLYHRDFIKFGELDTYDLIIGNPPYFVMKKTDVPSIYHKYFDGRPNIFIIFIIKSLHLLKKDGILSLVLPKSFLNCLYYNKTRKYIIENYKILTIIECDDEYLDTKQETIILIVQNKKDVCGNTGYMLNYEGNYILGNREIIDKLRDLYAGSTTLSQMGCRVFVGTVVWNQNKEILTNDATKTRLIYSSDIKDNELILQKYANKEKKNYIDKAGCNEPVLVINRGYGVGNYKFDYCLIEGGFEYLIENHLICVKCELENEGAVAMYERIISSLENPKTIEFIKLYFGNNAINTTELAHIVPFFI
jgi:type I restriction-modification system DNA methylase subunit